MKYNVGKKIQGKVRKSCETTLKVLFFCTIGLCYFIPFK